MHFMPACSVYKACRAAAPGADDAIGPWTAKVASKPDVCRRLNLVATACRHDTGMGGMAGCRANFNDMCAAGSVVEMCEAMPGFPDLPTTKALNAAVRFCGFCGAGEAAGTGRGPFPGLLGGPASTELPRASPCISHGHSPGCAQRSRPFLADPDAPSTRRRARRCRAPLR
jgi:hypothetical protein